MKNNWEDPTFVRQYKRAWEKKARKKKLAYYRKYYRANSAKIIARVAAWRRDNPLARIAEHLKGRYRLSAAEYIQMAIAQNGRCALCGEKPIKGAKTKTAKTATLHVDHDHATGKCRALLCHKCNTGLGLFNDDIALLEKALAYLVSHSADSAVEKSA